MIVLFHVTADTTWSNLPLSGLFVDMLRRIVARGERRAGGQSRRRGRREQSALPPWRTLDGFGVLGAPPATAKPCRPTLPAPATPNIRRASTARPTALRGQCAGPGRDARPADYAGLQRARRRPHEAPPVDLTLAAARWRSSASWSTRWRACGLGGGLVALAAPPRRWRWRCCRRRRRRRRPAPAAITRHARRRRRRGSPMSRPAMPRSTRPRGSASNICPARSRSAPRSRPASPSRSIPRATNSPSIRCSTGRSSRDRPQPPAAAVARIGAFMRTAARSSSTRATR